MSYFSGDNQNPTQQTTQSNPDDFVKQLVDQKGDQWTDPQVIAKGKLESDAHIKSLEEQNKELRDELGKQDYAKTLLDRLGEQGTPTPTGARQVNGGGTEQENTTPQFSEEQIESLVQSKIEGREVQLRKDANLKQVDAKLSEMFGSDASKTVEKKAAELGLSREQMVQIAEDSPSAFLRLVGDAPAKESNQISNPVINTSVDSFSASSGERDWNYYQKLRRENRTTYFSPAVQRQMMEDKKRLGDKFGN